jgi:hypothetical protein
MEDVFKKALEMMAEAEKKRADEEKKMAEEKRAEEEEKRNEEEKKKADASEKTEKKRRRASEKKAASEKKTGDIAIKPEMAPEMAKLFKLLFKELERKCKLVGKNHSLKWLTTVVRRGYPDADKAEALLKEKKEKLKSWISLILLIHKKLLRINKKNILQIFLIKSKLWKKNYQKWIILYLNWIAWKVKLRNIDQKQHKKNYNFVH